LLIHGTYPFFTHTRLIGKLGILEYLFVTPSHHRVHHASNPEYLDKNYGDMLIIWDKLFGTFKEEKEEPNFGLTKPLESHSFLWQHFHYLLEVLYVAKREKGWRNKLKVLFGSPAVMPAEARSVLEKRYLFRNKQNPTSANRFKNYVLGQFIAVLILLFVFILIEAQIPFAVQMMISGVILLTLINCGAILEQRLWVFPIEYLRGLLLALISCWFFPSPTFLALLLMAVVGTLLYASTLRERYLQMIYR